MKNLKEQLEIDFLKSLTYTEINGIINDFKQQIDDLKNEAKLNLPVVSRCFCVEDTDTSEIESIHLDIEKAGDEILDWNRFKPSKSVRIVERELT